MLTAIIAGQTIDMSLFNGIKPRNINPGGMSGRVTAFAADPSIAAPDANALRKNYERAVAFGSRIETLNENLKGMSQVRESLAKSKDLMAKDPGFAETLTGIHKTVSEDLARLDEAFSPGQDGLLSRINGYRTIVMVTGVLSQQEEKSMNDAAAALDQAEKMTDDFFAGPWKEYRETLSNISLQGDIVLIK